MKLRSKPYLDILKELGYEVLEDDIDSTYEASEDYCENDDVYVCYFLTYFKGLSRVILTLECDGVNLSRKFFATQDPTVLEISEMKVYYIPYDDYDDSNLSDEDSLVFYDIGTRDENELNDISNITPESFKNILKSKESRESELEYENKILQRYLDTYNNIIKPIVNPVAKLKNLKVVSTISDGFDYLDNRNIELEYYTINGTNCSIKYTIGINYITGKLYFYVDNSDIMFNFEDLVTTKGKFKELLKNYGI